MKKFLAFSTIAITAVLMLPAAYAVNDEANLHNEALENWEIEPLYEDWPITAITGDSVFSLDDERVGHVNDVLIDNKGAIQAIIVRQLGAPDGWQYYKVLAAGIEFDPLATHTDTELTAEQVEDLPKPSLPALVEHNNFESSDLLGMPVDLNDSKAYGELVNLMVDPDTQTITAFVIEAAGKGHSTFAVPANFGAIDRNEERLTLDYLDDEIEVFGMFFIPQMSADTTNDMS